MVSGSKKENNAESSNDSSYIAQAIRDGKHRVMLRSNIVIFCLIGAGNDDPQVRQRRRRSHRSSDSAEEGTSQTDFNNDQVSRPHDISSISQLPRSPKANWANDDHWRRILLLVIAVTVHNIPEGLAVGVGFGAVGKTPKASFETAR